MFQPHANQSAIALHVDSAFERAHAGAAERDARAALQPVRDIGPGQPFILDSKPHEMCIRGTRVPGLEPGEVTVVVIAVDGGGDVTQVGRIFSMQAHHTVRVVDVVAPLKGKARG